LNTLHCVPGSGTAFCNHSASQSWHPWSCRRTVSLCADANNKRTTSDAVSKSVSRNTRLRELPIASAGEWRGEACRFSTLHRPSAAGYRT
jgi:hypothetical protein